MNAEIKKPKKKEKHVTKKPEEKGGPKKPKYKKLDDHKKEKVENKNEPKKPETKNEPKKPETKPEEKKEEKKIEIKKPKVMKKEIAIANGYSLRVSPKHSIAVCKTIKGKSPEAAISRLEEAIKGKRPIPMAGLEVAHQKGKGIAGAKYPRNACKEIIEIIKQVLANSIVNGIENPIITLAKTNRASAPLRKGGRKSKRAHVHIEVRDKSKLVPKRKNQRRTKKKKSKK